MGRSNCRTFSEPISGANSRAGRMHCLRIASASSASKTPKKPHHSGKLTFETSEPSGEDEVSGTLFEISDDELEKADRYEEPASDYRVEVTLRSGRRAWIYTHRPKEKCPEPENSGH